MNYSRRLASRDLVRKKADLAALIFRITAFIALFMICVAGVRLFSSRSRTSGTEGNAPLSTTSNTAYLGEFQRAPKIEARSHRLVYPYSIVPGGIWSADELRQAAAHDSVVASHYAGFNYRRARLVEVKQAQKVYLSYRLHNKVYWTVRQASLHPGEKLLTDGTLTARTRCGNQVSVLPHVAISPDEPTLAELDRPDAMASGIEGLPAAAESRLLAVDPALPFGPSNPGATGMVGGGGPPVIFVPPPIGGGGNGGGGNGGGGGGGGHPPETPEPGTIVLVLSGAGIIFARYRKR